MNSLKVPLVIACVAAIVAVTGSYAGDGFKLPNLNPFSSKPKPASSGFSLVNKTPKPKPKKPGMLTQMSRGTQKMVSNTADFLTPWDNKPKMPASRPQLTGSRGTKSGSSITASQPKKQGNWLTRMFSSEEKNEAPRTANEFLGQPRLTY